MRFMPGPQLTRHLPQLRLMPLNDRHASTTA